jgi:hypothetical protein
MLTNTSDNITKGLFGVRRKTFSTFSLINFLIYLNTIFVKLLIKDKMNKSEYQHF